MGAGEIHELKEELHSLDKHKQMDAVKKGAPTALYAPPHWFAKPSSRLVGGRTSPVAVGLSRLWMTGGTAWSTLSMGIGWIPADSHILLIRRGDETRGGDVRRVMDATVIAAMTVGKDVSTLFPDVVNCMQTDNLELKKLVYLYCINYAKTQPDLAIMAVNTFVKVGPNSTSTRTL